MHIWHMPAYQRTCALIAVLDHQGPFQPFHNDSFEYHDIYLYKLSHQHHLIFSIKFNHECHRLLALSQRIFNMEYHSGSIAFWTADPEAHILSSTIEQVYNAFFYTTSMHQLHQQSKEFKFGCFVTMFNAAFKANLH